MHVTRRSTRAADRADSEIKDSWPPPGLPLSFACEANETGPDPVCRLAVESRSIYEHPDKKYGNTQLIVVGQFRPKDEISPTLVLSVFNENPVKLSSSEEIPKLIDEIRRTGIDIDGTPKA